MQRKNVFFIVISLFLVILLTFSSCMSIDELLGKDNHDTTLPSPESDSDTKNCVDGNRETHPSVTLQPEETTFYDPSDNVDYPSFAKGSLPPANAELTSEQLVLPTNELVDLIFSRDYYHRFIISLFFRFYLLSNSNQWDSLLEYYDEFGNRYFHANYGSLKTSFNGIQELETRPDAATVLLAKYKRSLTDTAFEEFGYITEFSRHFHPLTMPTFLEIVLSQDVFMNQLTEAEKAELYETIPKIRGTRGPDDRNANHFDMSYLFFDYYTYKEWKELQGE